MGIFVFYDKSGKVDTYVEVLLESILKILEKVIIIVNGEIEKADYNKLCAYSNAIYIRKNIGFDAGAYKDVFTKYLLHEDWNKWEEIVLLNDTFYGPLYPWENVFDKMEKEEIDFWGLSRSMGVMLPTGRDVPQHIQSYFLVCRKRLFLSECWKQFWDNLAYPDTYLEAIENFEVNFSVFFSKNGFKNRALTDNSAIQIEYGRNPYFDYLYELICCIQFPVIKRRVFGLVRFEEIGKAFDYIRNNTDYNIDNINSHLMRLQREGIVNFLAPFALSQLELFYHKHKRIFIYGYGKYGKGMARFFEYKGWHFEGFLTSDFMDSSHKVFLYKDVNVRIEDGVILALGKKGFYEVYPIIQNDLDNTQLCLPCLDGNAGR